MSCLDLHDDLSSIILISHRNYFEGFKRITNYCRFELIITKKPCSVSKNRMQIDVA